MDPAYTLAISPVLIPCESVCRLIISLIVMSSDLMPDSHYKVPESNPTLTLSFDEVLPPHMDPPLVLLSMIENMQPICRHSRAAFPPRRVFDYALARTTFRSFPCGSLTYHDVCTALRGLAEFMTLQNQFYQWKFQIWVNGYALGSGQIQLIRMLPAASAAGLDTS